MEREEKRKYPIFEQLSTEELNNLLAQDFAAMDEEGPDVDYIMAIMEVINKREQAAEHQTDVDAAWKEFQEQYQGQAAAFDRSNNCETDSSHRNQTSSTSPSSKKSHTLRILLIAAVMIALLCGTASGFGRVFQAVVNWTAETFGFESPYGETVSAEAAIQEDPYIRLRSAVAEYTDLPVIPNWAPEGTNKTPNTGVQTTERRESVSLSGFYQVGTRQFLIRIRIYNTLSVDYTGSYQWDATQTVLPYNVSGIRHDIVCNTETATVAWTNENVECLIQGDLSMEELKAMIDSIYEE
ncbi:DUF4367 domain-containing protein [Dysosmobacter sp. Sow4_B12]|uniref:DUF4367 domain-containing protein n=1 Tax=Dysosmobacter sp. Sow4_B12 TaxID=3438777 RepID=UPI003F932B3B